MKILFLDIDGVMNTMSQLVEDNDFRFICPDRVRILARIVKETDCKIVLSSAWRTAKRERNMVKEALAKENLVFVSETPQTCSYPRSTEISEWLIQHDKMWTDYVILDDEPDAGIGNHFWRTDENVGLTDEIADQIIAYLNRDS